MLTAATRSRTRRCANCWAWSRRACWMNWWRRFREQSAEMALRLVHRLIGDGQNLQHFCREAIRHFRNLLVARVCGADSELVAAPQEERPRLAEQAARFSEEDLTRFFQYFAGDRRGFAAGARSAAASGTGTFEIDQRAAAGAAGRSARGTSRGNSRGSSSAAVVGIFVEVERELRTLRPVPFRLARSHQ